MKQSVVLFYKDFADSAYRIMAEMMAAPVHLVLSGYDVVLLTDSETSAIYTSREMEILNRLFEGSSNSDIGFKLSISEYTV